MKWVGIDVSKKTLDICVLENSKIQNKQFANDAKGHLTVLERMLSIKPDGIVIEPTGIYHQQILLALQQKDLPVFLIHPAQVKAFRTALGQRNKGDQQDAWLLAQIGQTFPQALRKPNPCHELQMVLRQLMGYREDLLQRKTALLNRLAAETHSQTKTWIQEDVAQLTQRLGQVETQIQTILKQIPEAKALDNAIKGVAEWTIASVLAWLPNELWGKAKAASGYAGIHPENQQSGTSLDKAKLSKKGPPEIRKHLHMAALATMQWNLSLIHISEPTRPY